MLLVRRGRLAAAAAAQAAAVLAIALLVARLPAPTSHAYAATGAVVGAYALFHATVAALVLAFQWRRGAAGCHSARRAGGPRIARLWSDHASGAAIAAAAVLVLPAWLA